jgi:CBS domain-containing protein
MRSPRLVLSNDLSAREAHDRLAELGLPGAPVRDRAEIFEGSVDAERLGRAGPEQPLRALVDGTVAAVPDDATLDAVVEIFATERVDWVPVLDAEHRIVGVVGTADLIAAYRSSLAGSLRNLRSIFSGPTFLEEEVSGGEIEDRAIGDAGWPDGTVVVAIQRGDQLIFPEPSTLIRRGDVLSALVPRAREDRFRELLGANPSSEKEEPEDEPMI